MIRRLVVAGCLTGAIAAMPRVAGSQGRELAASDSAGGQSACLVLNGIRIGATWGDSTGPGTPAADTGRGFRLDGRTTLDTVLTFDVAERRWMRSSLLAYVAGGVSGTTRAAAPGAPAASGPRSGWHACVGATLAMQRPTIVLRGVRGQLHFKVDLTPLTRIPGSTLGDSIRRTQ